MNLRIKFDRDVSEPNHLTMLLLKFFRPKKIEWTSRSQVNISGADLLPPIGTLRKALEEYKEHRGKFFEWLDFLLETVEFDEEERQKIPSLILADKLQ